MCKISEIAVRNKACLPVVEGLLFKLQEEDVVALIGEEIRVTPEQRMRIAELAILGGADPEKVARELVWQEFESFAARILSREGYATVNHFVFKRSTRRYEIDILAAKETMVLCLDCKHWHRGSTPSKIMAAAGDQSLRVRSLSDVFALYETKHHIRGWRSAQLLPIVLTLADVPYKLMGGVPIVPILRLGDFLRQVGPWAERLGFLSVPASSQTLLSS